MVFIGKSKNNSPQAIFHIYSASPTAVCIYVTSQPISANVYEKRACSIHHPTHGGAELPWFYPDFVYLQKSVTSFVPEKEPNNKQKYVIPWEILPENAKKKFVW